jgi:uncharacterized protein (TIGR00297 family)
MALTDPIQLLLILLFLAIFSIFSYKKKLLDFEGICIGNAVGLAAIVFGPNPLIDLAIVVIFFVLGEIASNYPKKKHEQRTIWNVIGNSTPALIMLILIPMVNWTTHSTFLLELAFFGAISAALSDTLSSEVGYYSKKSPILITTFKKVTRGTDGGVTLLGESAALFGGIIIAAMHFYAYQNYFAAAAVLLAGMVGTNADSIAGALFERKGLLNNTHVNIIGSGAGAIFCLLLGLLV